MIYDKASKKKAVAGKLDLTNRCRYCESTLFRKDSIYGGVCSVCASAAEGRERLAPPPSWFPDEKCEAFERDYAKKEAKKKSKKRRAQLLDQISRGNYTGIKAIDAICKDPRVKYVALRRHVTSGPRMYVATLNSGWKFGTSPLVAATTSRRMTEKLKLVVRCRVS